MSKRILLGGAVVALVVTLAGVWWSHGLPTDFPIGWTGAAPAMARTATEPPALTRQEATDLEQADALSRAFARVARQIQPSVVTIRSARKVESRATPVNPFENSPFRDFFGDEFFRRFFVPRGGGRSYVQQGLGTGVIVSDDGYILTNNHVVEAADEVRVQLADERTFDARIVGTDPKTDLAVLRIDAEDLEPAPLGDSDGLEVGAWVVAVGNPFGLQSSITAGIVSAKGRANVGVADYEDFIQTDAAINPGNSGGPLVNLRGEVVGINTAILTKSGGYMGIGLAIPINMARSIMQSLIDEGRVVRGWLGVVIQNLDEDLAASFGYEGTDGVLVGDVTEDGPADRAGMQSGDIIVEYDGKPVHKMDALRTMVASTRPGTKVDIVVFRDGKKRTLRVKIGELETQLAAKSDAPASLDLGMTVRTLTPEIAEEIGVDAKTRGVVVTHVEPLGAASRAGLAPRDVIVSVQGEAVADVAAFRSVLKKHDLKKGVRLSVRRGNTRRFVFLKTRDDAS